MDLEEFHHQLAAAPLSFRRKLRECLRNPTERNACYIAGYVAALEDARLFKTDDAASYWLALIDRVEGDDSLCYDLIAEMDNPPEASTTLNEAESHAHICAKLAEEHKHDAVLFAALTDAAAIIRDLRNAVAAKQARIDALMLEYCPDEMTPEQVAEWARHQQPARSTDHE